jgi:predicted MFS family arabinose efflux permease
MSAEASAGPPNPMNPPAPAPGPKISRTEWGILLVLAAIQFTNILDFVIVMPLAPLVQKKYQITPEQFGYFVAAYGYLSCIGSLLAATFLDRFDRKRALLFLYVGFLLSTLFCGIAPDYTTLIAARALAGFFGGVTGSCVMAIVGDLFADYRRGTAMGAVMSSFALASIVGVPLGLLLAEGFSDTGAPFVAIAVFGTIVWIAAALILPKLRGHLTTHRAKPTWGELLKEPSHLWAFAFSLSIVFGGFLVIPYIADAMVKNNGQDEKNIKYVYLVAGLVTLVSTNLIGRLSDRFGKPRMYRIVAFIAVLTSIAFTNLPVVPLWVVIATATLFMVFTSGRMVPGQSLITSAAAPRLRAGFLSLNSAVQSIGMGLASTLSGKLIGNADDGRLPGYPIVGLVAAGFGLLSIYLVGFVKGAQMPPLPVGTADDRKPEPVTAVAAVEPVGN